VHGAQGWERPDYGWSAKAKRTGGLCTKRALLGTNPPRCRIHCGRKAAEVKAEYEVARRADRIYHDYPGIRHGPNDNALDDLLAIKNDALRWHDVCRQLVGELTEVRYKSRSAEEQLRAEIAVFERSLDHAARICADLVRLGIEQRIVRVNTTIAERDTEILITAITGTLRDLGHNTDQAAVAEAAARNMRTATAQHQG